MAKIKIPPRDVFEYLDQNKISKGLIKSLLKDKPLEAGRLAKHLNKIAEDGFNQFKEEILQDALEELEVDNYKDLAFELILELSPGIQRGNPKGRPKKEPYEKRILYLQVESRRKKEKNATINALCRSLIESGDIKPEGSINSQILYLEQAYKDYKKSDSFKEDQASAKDTGLGLDDELTMLLEVKAELSGNNIQD